MRRIAAEVSSIDERVMFHVAQALYESSTADRMEISDQLGRALWPVHQLTHDEHSPLVADHLQCTGYWTAVTFTSSHRQLASIKSIRRQKSGMKKYACKRPQLSIINVY
jgi:hypothetical protein